MDYQKKKKRKENGNKREGINGRNLRRGEGRNFSTVFKTAPGEIRRGTVRAFNHFNSGHFFISENKGERDNVSLNVTKLRIAPAKNCDHERL